jgi:FtsP/CotA-like multicopper oxidase with cupredoxin domain
LSHWRQRPQQLLLGGYHLTAAITRSTLLMAYPNSTPTVIMQPPLELLCALTPAPFPGASTFGTYNHPTLPRFINGPKPGNSYWPWGNRNCSNTNPYQPNDIPNTGMTRHYDWTITNTTLSPDGVTTPVLVVNGAFPGPMIEANWGDWIEVTVSLFGTPTRPSLSTT